MSPCLAAEEIRCKIGEAFSKPERFVERFGEAKRYRRRGCLSCSHGRDSCDELAQENWTNHNHKNNNDKNKNNNNDD